MPFIIWLVLNTLLNHGVLVEPWQESQEFLDLVLADQDRPHLVTCAEKLECMHHLRSGESGTEKLTSPKEDTLSPLPLQHLHVLHLLWQEVTELTMSQNFLLFLTAWM